MGRGKERTVRTWAARVIGILLPAAGFAAPESPPAPPQPHPPRRVERLPEPEDPLEQWSLDPVPPAAAVGSVPAPSPAIPDSLATPAPLSPPETTSVPTDTVRVPVVHCRQILVSGPQRAAQLEKLLRLGVPLDKATKSLGITDLVQNTRTYAIDDLGPEIRAEIQSVPDSTWSRARPWRGRYALYQVLGREESPRSAVPKLGEGLDAQERSRLTAKLQRAPQPTVSQAPDASSDFVPASVEQQAPAEYPAAATGSGEVAIMVEVGRTGTPGDIRVDTSTDPIFEAPAKEAARNSRYRPATRSGIPEPGTVRLIYKFAAPQNP
jgi:TonB family protein